MQPKYVTGGGPNRLTAAVALHGENFKSDPVIRFLLSHLQRPEQEGYIPTFINILLKVAAKSNAIFDEVWTTDIPDNSTAPPACGAVWIRPGQKVGSLGDYISMEFVRLAWNLGLGGLKRMLIEFQASSDGAKRTGLVHPDGSKVERYHYLFFISTAMNARKQGLASGLVQKFQSRAMDDAVEAVPIWLEATTPESCQLYLSLDFKIVSSWILGKGNVNEKGECEKGGQGVPIWAMIWWPQAKSQQ